MRVGHDAHGMRDYYLPGDPPHRRSLEVLRWKLVNGRISDPNFDLHFCPECHYAGDLESFDVLGADEGNVFCPSCGLEVEVRVVAPWFPGDPPKLLPRDETTEEMT